MVLPTISIIGCGRTGGALALALTRAGYDATAWSRRPLQLRGVVMTPSPRLDADVVFVTVPDDAIAAVAASLETRALVVHCSGSLPLRVISHRRRGGMHPLQTLPDARRGADALAGCAIGCAAANPADLRMLKQLARAMGARPFDLPDAARPRYHAAAVLASSSVVAGAMIMRDAGIPGWALAPLVHQTAVNISHGDPAAALTGPVRRGDVETLRRTAAALRGSLRGAYSAMAILTATLAKVPLKRIKEAVS